MDAVLSRIKNITKVLWIVYERIDGFVVGKIDVDIQLRIRKREMGESTGSVFGLFEFFGVH
jgi:hypothetical protein